MRSTSISALPKPAIFPRIIKRIKEHFSYAEMFHNLCFFAIPSLEVVRTQGHSHNTVCLLYHNISRIYKHIATAYWIVNDSQSDRIYTITPSL